MGKTVKLIVAVSAVLAMFLVSCQNKEKPQTAAAQKAAGEIVDASKQVPLQGPFQKEQGSCWVAMLPQHIGTADNSKENSRSKLVLYEDGKPVGPAHALHDDIRSKGTGRYSHWEGYVYFSATDNSDPNKNGKKYAFSL